MLVLGRGIIWHLECADSFAKRCFNLDLQRIVSNGVQISITAGGKLRVECPQFKKNFIRLLIVNSDIVDLNTCYFFNDNFIDSCKFDIPHLGRIHGPIKPQLWSRRIGNIPHKQLPFIAENCEFLTVLGQPQCPGAIISNLYSPHSQLFNQTANMKPEYFVNIGQKVVVNDAVDASTLLRLASKSIASRLRFNLINRNHLQV